MQHQSLTQNSNTNVELASASKKISKVKNSVASEASIERKVRRHAWKREEDELLLNLIAEHGHHWATISRKMGGTRTGKQIRDRYLNKLVPGINNDKNWSFEEDQKLLKLYYVHGNKWCNIARELPGRTETMVKNRFYGRFKCHLEEKFKIPVVNSFINTNISPMGMWSFVPTEKSFFDMNSLDFNFQFNNFKNFHNSFNFDFQVKSDEHGSTEESKEQESDELAFIDFNAQDDINRSMFDEIL